MSQYRLSTNEEKKLNLTEVTWEWIKDHQPKNIYIRSSSNAPVYGPYRIMDYQNQILCRQDGTKPKPYSRNKGLLLPQDESIWLNEELSQPPTTKVGGFLGGDRKTNSLKQVLLVLLQLQHEKIQIATDALNQLQKEYHILERTCEELSTKGDF